MIETKWEYCEILRSCDEGFFHHTYCFYAEALSPKKGKYIAMKSDGFKKFTFLLHFPYTEPARSEAEQYCDQLIDWLVKDGWEPLPERGENWWNLRFRRKL